MNFRFHPFCYQSTIILGTLTLAIFVSATAHAQQQQGRQHIVTRTTTTTTVADDPTVDVVADGKGRINYDKGVVKATGYGVAPARAVNPAQARLMAMGAARADALRTLAMTVSSIQVTATTKVKNYELQNDTVETRLSALLQGPRVVSEIVQPDGTAVVTVELPLYGQNSVAAIVLPEVLSGGATTTVNSTESAASNDTNRRVVATNDLPADTAVLGTIAPAGGAGANERGQFTGPAEPAVRVAMPAPRPVPSLRGGVEPGLTPGSDSGPFSALIVDCRGLNVDAIMSPKLMDTTGREVYGTVRVTPEYAIETGIVGYPRSMAEALHTARAGSHPLIVRGLRVADKHRFNPVIALEDADRVLAANNRDHFLEQTRVIFLVDPVR